MFLLKDLRELTEENKSPAISLYMPTHATGRERQEDEIRHKNLLRKIETEMVRQDFDKTLIDKLLTPLAEIPDHDSLWRHRSAGLAAFVAPEFSRTHILPMAMPEYASVDERFHLSPLLSLLQANGNYYLLCLTKDSAELFEATRFSRITCELEIPTPMEIDGEQALQLHSHQAPTQGKGGVAEAIFHAQGAPDDREKVDITNYFKRRVEPQVTQELQNQNIPLVLACVDYLAPIYHEANSYPHLLEEHVAGNPDEMSEEDLLSEAWKCVEPYFRKAESQATEKYGDLLGSERSLADEEAILEAARNGRVETIFVPNHSNGQSTTSSAVPKVNPVVEESVYQTLNFGGKVFAVDEIPTKEEDNSPELAAILRY